MNIKYMAALLSAAILLFLAAYFTRITSPRPGRAASAELQDLKSRPLVALTTVALGGFRGLLVDILWMRLITTQTEGKVFEIVQLADWITKLEPEFAAVWAFHAWNMAYNISVLYANPEHRWLWINNAMQLLRDNGIRLNPHEPLLYWELGWIYQHKIGQNLDEMHLYYKISLAQEMNDLFSGARPDFLKISSPTNAPAGMTKKMRDTYKLYPEIMQAIEHEYGTLDWRLPETHALYWAWCGRQEAAPGKNTYDCDHMIVQAMAAAFRQGRLFFDAAKGEYITTPCFNLLAGACRAYEDAIARQGGETFKVTYAYFLAEAAFIMHAYGHEKTARALFEKMLALQPQLRRSTTYEKHMRHCDEIAVSELSAPYVVILVEGLLYQSYGADKQHAKALHDKALRTWEQYTDNCEREHILKRFWLPPFQLIEEQARQRAEEERKDKQ
jgi:hypothetical protein